MGSRVARTVGKHSLEMGLTTFCCAFACATYPTPPVSYVVDILSSVANAAAWNPLNAYYVLQTLALYGHRWIARVAIFRYVTNRFSSCSRGDLGSDKKKN